MNKRVSKKVFYTLLAIVTIAICAIYVYLLITEKDYKILKRQTLATGVVVTIDLVLCGLCSWIPIKDRLINMLTTATLFILITFDIAAYIHVFRRIFALEFIVSSPFVPFYRILCAILFALEVFFAINVFGKVMYKITEKMDKSKWK